jgi:limonene-1,2-epoxide hydrolase
MKSTEVVREFLRAWESPGEWRNALRRYLTEDCAYELVGFAKRVGPEQLVSFVDAFNETSPFHYMSVVILNIAECANIVMTERVDHFHDASGAVFSSLPTMGIFEVTNSKINAWRDYCDLSPFNKQD